MGPASKKLILDAFSTLHSLTEFLMTLKSEICKNRSFFRVDSPNHSQTKLLSGSLPKEIFRQLSGIIHYRIKNIFFFIQFTCVSTDQIAFRNAKEHRVAVKNMFNLYSKLQHIFSPNYLLHHFRNVKRSKETRAKGVLFQLCKQSKSQETLKTFAWWDSDA